MSERIVEKLSILADAAKYDVSCSSSGSNRKNENKGLGNASNGICHSYTEDGRCISLLKILLTNVNDPLLDMQIDPKLNWALKNLHQFPLDINTADYKMIMRIPGIGIGSAQKICEARKHRKLDFEHLKKIGIALNRAKHFIVANKSFERVEKQPWQIKELILAESRSKYFKNFSQQINLF